jgi:hypothetical protein
MSEPAEDPPQPSLPMTVDSPIFWAEELIDHVELRAFYKAKGVKCFACCAAEIETFADGAKVHAGAPYGAFDAATLVDELNALAKRHPFSPKTAYNPGIFAKLLDLLFPGKA